MFDELIKINVKPEPYEFYTAEELWTNEHTAQKMLEYHLDPSVEAASRNLKFINKSVEWIIDHFKLGGTSRVIDFGCGPGLYTSRIAQCGAKVTGIDFSENSLCYAKKYAHDNGLDVQYIQSNYLEYETDEMYDLIIMIMCDFTALSPSQRSKLLSKFSSMLKPDGSILLDVYSTNYYNLKEEQSKYELNSMDNFWSKNDYYCFVNTFKYSDENLILDKYTIYEKSDTRVVYNWYQCFSIESIKNEFCSSGLKITEFYSDVAGSIFDIKTNEFAIVAQRK